MMIDSNSISSKVFGILPPSYRLAGEDDFFNQTKFCKLKPFRRQTGHTIQPRLEFKSSSCNMEKSRGEFVNDATITTCELTRVQKVCFHSREGEASRLKREFGPNRDRLVSRKSISNAQTQEKAAKNHKTGSEIKSSREEHLKLAFDKLFSNKPGPDYPFANPMPECMIAEGQINNLREIVVSSFEIEWRMMTSLRPETDYIEKYFDKLIYLHRSKYKTQLESGCLDFSNKASPFKYTRHTYLLNNSYLSRGHKSISHSLSTGKTNSAQQLKPATMNIPTLTVTSDETSEEPIKSLNETKNDGGDGEYLEDLLDYGAFSRFSPANLKFFETNCRRLNQSSSDKKPNRKKEEQIKNEESFEDRVDDIINNLLSNSEFKI